MDVEEGDLIVPLLKALLLLVLLVVGALVAFFAYLVWFTVPGMIVDLLLIVALVSLLARTAVRRRRSRVAARAASGG